MQDSSKSLEPVVVETSREEMFVIWTQHGVSVVKHQ
jgi:hypothetical protein